MLPWCRLFDLPFPLRAMTTLTEDTPGLPPLESLLRRSEKRTASVFLGTDIDRRPEEKRCVRFWREMLKPYSPLTNAFIVSRTLVLEFAYL